jgi:branched-chain amino acid transport system ATP-binding protein
MAEYVLEASNITVNFGGLQALGDVGIQLPRATIVGLLGPNGAGKSTLLGVLSGNVHAQAGRVAINGTDITRLQPHARVRRGLARTFQHPELYSELTVEEHLVLAARWNAATAKSWRRMVSNVRSSRRHESSDTVDELLQVLGLDDVADLRMAGAPLGVCRLVELGRALATQPEVVLLDEPSSGLDSDESKRLAAALIRIVEERGTSFLLVEHDVELVFSLASRVSVLDFGRLIAEGTPEDVKNDEHVRSAYLGEMAPVAATAVSRRPVDVDDPEPLLTVSDLRVCYGAAVAIDGVSITAHRGGVTTLLGPNGAGKSTLARAIAGLIPAASGAIRLDGHDIGGLPATRVNRLGLAYLPEGRGVFPTLTVSENLQMAVVQVPARERAAAIERMISFFPVLGQRQKQLAATLSGGEQQMLALARVLAKTPRLLIADEVSLGLAPLVVDKVFEGLHRAIDEGISVVLIEQFVHRALELADTCYIMRRGRVVWHGPGAHAQTEILDHYLGSEIDASALTEIAS